MRTRTSDTLILAVFLAGTAAMIVAASASQAHGTTRSGVSATGQLSPATPTPPPSTRPAPSGSLTPNSPAPIGSATPAEPTPTPPPGQPPGASSGGCGLFDVGCKVKEAINGFFRGVVAAALNPVFRFLARSVLSSPRVDQIDRVRSLWTTSAWIANTSFIVLVVLGGMLVMGHQTLQTSYTVKDIAPRLVIAMVAANMNLLVIGPAIDFANALSVALMGNGVDPGQAANTLKGLVLKALTDANDLFMPFLALVAVVVGLLVLIVYIARVMLLVLLAAAAPLALACHALPQSDGLARLWWRALAGVLAIQVAQSLVFATAVRVFFTSDQADLFGFKSGKGTFDLLLVICLLYILARIPSWVSQMIFRGGMRRSPINRMARTLATILIFRGLGGKLTGPAAAKKMPGAPPQRPPIPSGPRPVPPGPRPVTQSRWVQPELPLGGSSPRGEQLELPLQVPGRASPQPRRHANWTQLRLPDKTANPPRWRQPVLPIRLRYEQTRLPAPPPRRHVQPPLPLAFPQRGTPQAGRSPRRLADQAALRHAEARARQRRRPQ
jgi:hypothetical protein